MADNDKIVKFWRGQRNTYNTLANNGQLDYWTRYTVIESDGRRSEYFGAIPVTQATGELYPVLSVVSTLPETLNVGDRYLVGVDATYNEDGTVETEASYYVVEIAADKTKSTVNPIGNHSVRVIDRKLKSYILVDGKLITYDGDSYGGTF